MKLDDRQTEHLLELATTAARRAAAHIRAESGRPRRVLSKEGGSSHASQVVTEVDFESQRLILDTLGASIAEFDLGLLTEESADDSSRHASDYFWCIDPLDGTLPFIEGVSGYSVSIALVSRTGVPQIGVILDPVEDSLVHAIRGGGAFRDDTPISLAPESGAPLTLVMDRSFAQQENYELVLERVRGIAVRAGLDGIKIINQGGAAMNACWVLENAPAVYFKFPRTKLGGGSLWDYAASACIFGEVEGAEVSNIRGGRLALNRAGHTFMNEDGMLFASNRRLAEAVIELSREIQ